MVSWINLVPDCRKAWLDLPLYQKLFKKAFTCIYFLNKDSFFWPALISQLRCCHPRLWWFHIHILLELLRFFFVQDYSMHNADDYTILHLLLIKNKYVTLPLFAPSKILTTISFLKKYKPWNQEAVSVTSSSRQTAHWKCNTLLPCHRSAGKWQSEF